MILCVGQKTDRFFLQHFNQLRAFTSTCCNLFKADSVRWMWLDVLRSLLWPQFDISRKLLGFELASIYMSSFFDAKTVDLEKPHVFFLPNTLETFQACMQWFAQSAWLGISGSSHVLVGSQQATLFKDVGEHYMWNVPCRVSKFVNWFLLWGPSSLARSSRMFDTKFNWHHPGSPEVWSPIRKKNQCCCMYIISVYILIGHMQRLVTPFVSPAFTTLPPANITAVLEIHVEFHGSGMIH